MFSEKKPKGLTLEEISRIFLENKFCTEYELVNEWGLSLPTLQPSVMPAFEKFRKDSKQELYTKTGQRKRLSRNFNKSLDPNRN
jgi:hypothetical protein